jgi:signal transduction histidine kinase
MNSEERSRLEDSQGVEARLVEPLSALPGGLEDLARIIHDLNQPLTAINNYAQAGCFMIERGVPDPDRLQELFEKIARQSSRTFEISQQLSRFSRNLGRSQETADDE